HPPTTDFYTLSLHDALPILIEDKVKRRRLLLEQCQPRALPNLCLQAATAQRALNSAIGEKKRLRPFFLRARPLHSRDDRQSKRRSEEHTSELQSLAYLVCRL